QVHRQRVDVHRFRLDTGVTPGDFRECAAPEPVAEDQDVRLVGHAYAPQPALLRIGERGLEDSLHPFARIDLDLLRDFVGSALPQDATGPGVQALGVLAKDDELEVLAPLSLQRAEPVVDQDAGAQVDVQVQLEAHREEDALGVLVAWNARIADGAEVDGGVLAAQRIHEPRREGRAIAQVPIGAEIEPVELQRKPEALQHAHADARDFRAASVAWADGDALGP